MFSNPPVVFTTVHRMTSLSRTLDTLCRSSKLQSTFVLAVTLVSPYTSIHDFLHSEMPESTHPGLLAVLG